ncbi:hypothetical protein ONS95_001763 [Cadophora gregata]|uniref:uncharacterized protein n=1 Tax=Cadophora gregata TaxID=51156 RepID=UPI0026DD1BF5|nr:uncharacterized protein ONS95_001763 [Cadophora gregata]KAK0111402.1 hypothetical protein ONS95_001763 [Cadophora gregata]KAK0112120.1 hypothetical protein ONS96_001378 [Cadophora gregata f. sp. sojae]
MRKGRGRNIVYDDEDDETDEEPQPMKRRRLVSTTFAIDLDKDSDIEIITVGKKDLTQMTPNKPDEKNNVKKSIKKCIKKTVKKTFFDEVQFVKDVKDIKDVETYKNDVAAGISTKDEDLGDDEGFIDDEDDDQPKRKRPYKPHKKNRGEGKGPARVKKYTGGNHAKKAQDDPTLAPWAVVRKDIPDDGLARNKFGRTKEEVIQNRRNAAKVRRDNRSEQKKKDDAAATKKWREDNAEYVEAFDWLRHADQVANYTLEHREKLRLEGREKWHQRVLKDFLENPVKGVRVPETGRELQKRCMVLTELPFEVSTLGVHVIILARKSWKAENNEHIELETTNWLIFGKFMRDFLAQTPVLSAESIVWHGRCASAALPWVTRDNADGLPLHFLDPDLWNETNDRKFSNSFSAARDHSTVVVVGRGVDGGSTNTDSWTGLQLRYPKFDIVLAYTFAEVYARFRTPLDSDWLYKTNPYDERIYAFFPLRDLIDHVSGVNPQPKFAWLISEWKAATVWRQAFSVAYQFPEPTRTEKVKEVQDAYFVQRFRPRNTLPLYV